MDPAARTALTSASYVVSPDSDRVGLRLTGPVLERRDDRELPSEGIVLGAVQVPPSGRPVVFLHDHPVTGGYPVVAVVHPDDLPRCAQLQARRRGALQRSCHGLSSGSSTANERTGPAGLSRVSNRTVTTPRPEPHTQPAPSVGVDDVGPGSPGDVPPRGHVRGQLLVGVAPVAGVAEQVLLDPVGQAGHADAEQPHAAGGVEVGEQAAGEPGDGAPRCRSGRAAWSTG